MSHRPAPSASSFVLAISVLAACGGEAASSSAPAPVTVRPVVEPVVEVEAPSPVPEVPELPVEPPPPAAAPVVLTPGGADRLRMAFGSDRGLAIGSDGRVYQFPLSATATSAVATPVDGVEHAESIAVGWEVACVVTSEHRVVCWSERGAGPRAVPGVGAAPAPVDAFVDAQAVVVTREAVCARDGAGAVTCLGGGLLGDHARAPGAFSLPLPSPAIQIASGANAVCVALNDGALHCAGYVGSRGFTGYGGPRAVRVPFPIGSLAMHDDNVCVLSASSGSVACGGAVGEWFYEDIDFEDDERGPVSAMEAEVDPFEDVDILEGATALATNVNDACAIMHGGGLRCWGTPYRDGRTEGFVSRAAPGMRGVTEIVAGGADRRGYTCAIQGDLPVCFTSERIVARGTPGQPRFTICSAEGPDGTCVELRLAVRGRSTPPVTVTADAPAAPATPSDPAAPRDPASQTIGGVHCVVADPSGTPLNVRADASARAEVVGTLTNGTDVTSDDTRGHFLHLTAPVVGWAWSDNLACP